MLTADEVYALLNKAGVVFEVDDIEYGWRSISFQVYDELHDDDPELSRGCAQYHEERDYE